MGVVTVGLDGERLIYQVPTSPIFLPLLLTSYCLDIPLVTCSPVL